MVHFIDLFKKCTWKIILHKSYSVTADKSINSIYQHSYSWGKSVYHYIYLVNILDYYSRLFVSWKNLNFVLRQKATKVIIQVPKGHIPNFSRKLKVSAGVTLPLFLCCFTTKTWASSEYTVYSAIHIMYNNLEWSPWCKIWDWAPSRLDCRATFSSPSRGAVWYFASFPLFLSLFVMLSFPGHGNSDWWVFCLIVKSFSNESCRKS